MKKNYIAPIALVTIVNCERIMSGGSITVEGDTASAKIGDDEEEYDGTFCSKRGSSLWDDED